MSPTEANLKKVLVVDDEVENLRAIERVLQSEFSVVAVSRYLTAIQALDDASFDVVLSDQRLTDGEGIELLLEAKAKQPDASRLLFTAYPDEAILQDAINRAEVYRFVSKPWSNEVLRDTVRQAAERSHLRKENLALITALQAKNEALRHKEEELGRLNRDLEKQVASRTEELRLANEKLSEMAMTDPLTKALNRRALEIRLKEEVERSERHQHPLAIAMLDIDHFKSFNDMEGHPRGDEALRKVAAVLQSNLRRIDLLCRYGGEEFLIVMPETRLENAREVCQRLRAQVELTPMQGTGQNAYLTISIGLACFPRDGEEPEALIQAADKALYEAKHLGRNRVSVYKT